MKIKKILRVVLMMVIMMGTISFFSTALPGQTSVVEAAPKIKISKTKATLIKGQTLQLKIIGTRTKTVWSSSNKKVAVVNSTGKVTAKGKGSATITAKINNKKYICKIQVEIPRISKTAVNLYKNESYTLKILNTKQKVTWKSSKASVAAVSNTGKITAKATGTATITATVSGKKYSCKITVKQKPVATSKVPVCVAEQTVYTRVSSLADSGDTKFTYLAIPECFIYIKNLDKNAQITDIKSTNPKITAYKRFELDAMQVSKSGNENLLGESSTISFKVIQNKKTYYLSCKINVKRGPSPFSEFKIGSKDIADHFYGVDCKTVSGAIETTLSVKMAPGYVLDKIVGVSISEGDGGFNYKHTVLKNGSTVKFGDYYEIYVTYHTTRPPANYVKETKWYGVGAKSPLHYSCSLDIFSVM